MLVARSKKLAFYGVVTTSDSSTTTEYTRMKNFTSVTPSKNPKSYSRQYVDEPITVEDVVGFAPAIAFAFDQYTENAVHSDIIDIADNEKIGDDAVRDIILVDLTADGTTTGGKKAIKRSYAVIVSSEGDKTDAYTYGGDFKAKGAAVYGEATTDDRWQTITFTAAS